MFIKLIISEEEKSRLHFTQAKSVFPPKVKDKVSQSCMFLPPVIYESEWFNDLKDGEA